MYRMFDGFCGRFGWSKAFLARGWEVIAVDLVHPPEIPDGVMFIQANMLTITADYLRQFDFACFSSPCEQFSVHGMKHFHPNPSYPELGIKLFNHTREIAEASGIPYVMENVRAAQKFVGNASHRCGPFALWGCGVPPLMPQGIRKGMRLSIGYEGFNGKSCSLTREQKREARRGDKMLWSSSKSPERKEATAQAATIPPELANCVAEYAERLMEQRRVA